MSPLVLALKVATISFLDVCKQSPVRLPRFNTINCCPSVNRHFQNGKWSVSVVLLAQNAANTSVLNGFDQSPLRLYEMHSQKLWMLHLRSSSEWGNDCVVCSFAKEGCQYVGCGLQRPHHFSISIIPWLPILDALLMLIFRVGQGACCDYF
jgi:hypothetical protein